MSTTHGKGIVISLDDSAAALRNISAAVDTLDFSEVVELAEDTAFGDSARSYMVGLKTATFSISGPWDDAATTGAYTVISGIIGQAASLSFEIGPEGNTSGDIKYSGECFNTGFSTSGGVGDRVSYTAEFTVSGAVTRGTYA